MEASDQKPFCLADFAPFLRMLVSEEDHSVLIGGMAVSAWGEIHLQTAEHADFDLPIYSKDVDLRGHKITASFLTAQLAQDGAEIHGTVTATRKEARHMGRIFASSLIWRNRRTSVEVLERLPGLDSSIDHAPCGTPLVIHSGLCLLDPCSLFICKLHAANSRPGGDSSNDVKHLKILARVIPRFLEKLRTSPVEGYDGHEDAERLLAHIEDCEAGRNPFQVPLSPAEIAALTGALRGHLR
jgi:hypothetical protein